MTSPAFTIQKKFAIPQPQPGRSAKYPFAQMKVGESFFVTPEGAGLNGVRVRSAATGFARRHSEFKFAVRKDGKGFRVWRISAAK